MEGKNLDEDKLAELCAYWARRFVRQFAQTGETQSLYDDLYNEAYVTAATRKTARAASSWIVWILARYVKVDKTMRTLQVGEAICEDNPLTILISKEERDRLIDGIINLSEERKTIILMYFGMDTSFKKIGERLGYSRTWIALELKEALKELKERIEK